MVWGLFAWVAGVALQLQQASLWPARWYGVLTLAGLGGLVVQGAWAWSGRRRQGRSSGGDATGAGGPGHRHSAAWRAVTAAFLFFAIAWGMTGWRAAAFSARALAPDLDNAEVRVVGYVASLPQLTPNGWRFEFRVEQAWRDGQPVNVPSRVGLSWWADPALPGAVVTPVARNMPVRLQAGERWELSVRLRRPHGPLNPHGFDRELWWWQQGVSATGTVRARAGSEARLLQAPMPLRYSVDRARQRVADAIRAQVDDPRSAGVLVALVTGDQSAIDRADWNVFRDTGVAHLMAISGLHVTMFAWLAAACVGALWRASARGSSVLVWRWPATQAAAVGGLLLATAYAVFSGWGIPSQRTVLMLLVVTVLRWRHADWPWPLTWGWVMAAVLLLDPWALLQAGFWLSFVAVGVLMAAGRPAGARPGLLQGLLREQALMTLALAPLTLLLFGQVSLVGLLANLPAIPWVTLGVTPLAMLGVLWPPAWTVGSWAMQGLVIGLEWLARWPWAVWHQAAAPWVWAVLGVLGGVLLVLRLPWPTRMLGVAMMWPALTHTPARPVPGTFDLLALDVGQGGAVLVRTASHSLLYDTGPAFWGGGDAGQQIVVPVLRRLGERLDLVMVSHSDVDHAGGTDAVLAAHPRAAYVASQAPQARSIADSRHGLSGLGRLCREGQHWQWDGVRFDILHPRPADVGGSSNAASCVLRISGGGVSAMLAGDIGTDQELRLALTYPHLRTDWLLAPHHGSHSSSSPAWLNTLRPRWVFIQSGHHNRFGHPAPRVLARYAQRDITWRSSPSCGAARWRSDRPDVLTCERDERPRYWRFNPSEARP